MKRKAFTISLIIFIILTVAGIITLVADIEVQKKKNLNRGPDDRPVKDITAAGISGIVIILVGVAGFCITMVRAKPGTSDIGGPNVEFYLKELEKLQDGCYDMSRYNLFGLHSIFQGYHERFNRPNSTATESQKAYVQAIIDLYLKYDFWTCDAMRGDRKKNKQLFEALKLFVRNNPSSRNFKGRGG